MIANVAKQAIARIGASGMIAIAVAVVLLLPFNIIAAIKLTGWAWWQALPAVLALHLLPGAGQLAYVGLAVAGAFYLGQDGLPPRQPTVAAIVQPAPTVQAPPQTPVAPSKTTPAPTQVPADKFTEWKRTVAAPAIEANCVDQAGRRGLVEGRQIEQMAKVCACYGAAAVTVVTEADVVDNVVQPSPSLNTRLSDEARRLCRSS